MLNNLPPSNIKEMVVPEFLLSSSGLKCSLHNSAETSTDGTETWKLGDMQLLNAIKGTIVLHCTNVK